MGAFCPVMALYPTSYFNTILVLAASRRRLHFYLSLAGVRRASVPTKLSASFSTSSAHLISSRSRFYLPPTRPNRSLFKVASSFILATCPTHLNLKFIIYRTTSPHIWYIWYAKPHSELFNNSYYISKHSS